jgi:hypothetical protein
MVLLAAMSVAAILLLMQEPAGRNVEATGSAPLDMAIAIDVDGGGDDCDTRPSTASIGTGCTVPVGASFTVREHIDNFVANPPTTGYIVFQTMLHYSAGLDRIPETPGVAELRNAMSVMYWDKPCNSIENEAPGDMAAENGTYFIDCWNSGGTGVSLYEGQIAEVTFGCLSAGHRSITLDSSSQVHNQNHASIFDKEGDQTLLINCKDAAVDTDGDTVMNGADADDDNDGCTDTQEQGGDKALGGQRNPHSVWDFFDTPDGANVRDLAVAGTDFFRVLGRFGATGTPGDPLSAPPAAPAYHSAFDRSPAMGGPHPWSLGAADGAITGQDFFAILGQFGDNCQP